MDVWHVSELLEVPRVVVDHLGEDVHQRNDVVLAMVGPTVLDYSVGENDRNIKKTFISPYTCNSCKNIN